MIPASRASAPWAAIAAVLAAGCSSSGDDPPAAPEPNPGPPTASALFVLGDSLSDVGNAAAAADYVLGQPIAPPTVGLCNAADVLVAPKPCEDVFYRKSRVSDGPVAVEYLAADLGLPELTPSLHVVPGRGAIGTNYAVASAKAREGGPEDLAAQLDALLLDRNPLPSDAVYAVMIGGNDALDAAGAAARAGGPTPESDAIVAAAVDAIGASLERLVAFGARRVVVANLPDLADLPSVRRAAEATGAPVAVATAITDAFDRALDERLTKLENDARATGTPLVLTRFDLRAALDAAEAETAARGGNTTHACFDSELYRDSPAAERSFAPDCAPVSGGEPRFDDFVFWDAIHPTGAAHARIGAALAALF